MRQEQYTCDVCDKQKDDPNWYLFVHSLPADFDHKTVLGIKGPMITKWNDTLAKSGLAKHVCSLDCLFCLIKSWDNPLVAYPLRTQSEITKENLG